MRWKFNTLTRKYKDCVDNSKRTGTGAMTFKFFDHMENILGDRKTVQGQSTISSTFAKKNPKSKSSTFMVQSDTSIPSPSTSSTESTNNTKKRMYEDLSKSESVLNKNKQVLKKVPLSKTETSVCSTSVNDIQKSKRPLHGSRSRTATNKVELEKQWLQHLKNLADRDEMKKEKQEAYEKRKAEEMKMKKKLIALKERQLDIKDDTAKRKLEETVEWHRDKLNIEKQKCQLLKELLKTRTSYHSKKRNKTDTDSSYED